MDGEQERSCSQLFHSSVENFMCIVRMVKCEYECDWCKVCGVRCVSFSILSESLLYNSFGGFVFIFGNVASKSSQVYQQNKQFSLFLDVT